MSLTQITQARWFPTVSRPLVAGVLTSGLVYGLHALGITSFEPNQLNAVTTPLAGFLVTAIVDYPERHSAKPGKAQPSLTKQMESLAVQVAHEELDSDPALVKELANRALQGVLAPAPALASPPPASPESTGVVK